MSKKYSSNNEACCHFVDSESIQEDYLLIIWVFSLKFKFELKAYYTI